MYELHIENEFSEFLQLTNNPNYDVIAVDGLNPAAANINTAAVSGLDGTRFNSAQIGQRNIVITLNIKQPIEENRINLYQYFRVKHPIRIWYKNDTLSVYIDGYVESFENDFFTKLQKPQISIICPDPFFKSNTETILDFDTVTALFEFPFDIEEEGIPFSELSEVTTTYFNAGNVETGVVITFTATANGVKNPTFYNHKNNTFIGVDVTMQASDVITIDTRLGKKSIKLKRGAAVTSLLNNRLSGSSWVVLEPGVNQISYSADEGQSSLLVSVQNVQQFEGV